MLRGIHGILSHRKLMELKNSGVIEPTVFDDIADAKYEEYIHKVADNIEAMNKGIWKYLGGYTRKRAEIEAKLMFSTRRELLEHMIILSGKSKFLSLTPNELAEFTVLHHAAVGTQNAEKVLMAFRYSDQVIVDEETGRDVDWVLKNSSVLRSILSK